MEEDQLQDKLDKISAKLAEISARLDVSKQSASLYYEATVRSKQSSPAKSEQHATPDKSKTVKPSSATSPKTAPKTAPSSPIKTTNKTTPIHQTKAKERKYLVYLCDGRYYCGGWGDRQRMMASMYMLAVLVGRELRLQMPTPCDITNFYLPHRVQWVVKGNELRTDSNITLELMYNKTLSQTFHDSLRAGDFNTKWPQKVIYLRGSHVFYGSIVHNKFYQTTLRRWRSAEHVFRWAWGELMQPRLSLLTRLEQAVGEDILVRRGIIQKSVLPPGNRTQTSKSLLLCAHVRYGKNPNNPKDQPLDRFNITDLPALMDFLNKHDDNNTARYYVASDYDLIREKFKSRFGGKVLDGVGKVVHVDRDKNDKGACEGFGVALLEQLILSVCDHLVITPSGFSRYAALTSNSTNPAYLLTNDHKFTIVKI